MQKRAALQEVGRLGLRARARRAAARASGAHDRAQSLRGAPPNPVPRA